MTVEAVVSDEVEARYHLLLWEYREVHRSPTAPEFKTELLADLSTRLDAFADLLDTEYEHANGGVFLSSGERIDGVIADLIDDLGKGHLAL